MSRQRAFIALPLSAEATSTLAQCQARLAKRLPDFRPIPPRNLHLTLVFLGDCDSQELAEIAHLMLSVGLRCAPLSAPITGLQMFGRAGRKRPLCHTLEPTRALLKLQGELADALETLGRPREKRIFRPHLTLGRVVPPGPTRDELAELEPGTQLTLTFDRLGLFTSRLLPQGAEHSLHTEAPLTEQ